MCYDVIKSGGVIKFSIYFKMENYLKKKIEN